MQFCSRQSQSWNNQRQKCGGHHGAPLPCRSPSAWVPILSSCLDSKQCISILNRSNSLPEVWFSFWILLTYSKIFKVLMFSCNTFTATWIMKKPQIPGTKISLYFQPGQSSITKAAVDSILWRIAFRHRKWHNRLKTNQLSHRSITQHPV